MPTREQRTSHQRLCSDTRGASFAEYLIVLACVALLGLGGWRAWGGSVGGSASTQGDCIASMNGNCGAPSGSAATPPGTTPGGSTTPGGGQVSSGDEDEGDDGCGWNPVCHAGNAAGWVADRGGDAAGWVRDRAGDAWDVGWELGSAAVSWQVNFDRGIWNGVWSSGEGLVRIFTDPLGTLEGLNYAGHHPYETAYVFLSQSWDKIQANPAQGLGEATWNIGSFFIPGGQVSGATTTAAKATAIGTNAAVYGSSAGSVASYGNNASNAPDVPGIVEWADRWIAPVVMPGSGNLFGLYD